jgi:hypothetical protein
MEGLLNPSVARDGTVSFGSDDRMFVQFFKGTRQNGFKSQNAGTPVFEPVDMVRIRQPGERDENVREVRDEDKQRWPQKWAAYVAGNEVGAEGTPLALLFPTEPEVVETLKYHRIITVQQLAALSDTGIQNVGLGARDMQAKARRFLEAADGAAKHQLIEAEIRKRDEQIAAMQDQIAHLTEALAKQSAPDAPRGPGRPPKAAQAA